MLIGWVFIFALMTITFPLETIIVKKDKLITYNSYRLIAGAIGAAAAFIFCTTMGANGAIIASLAGWFASVVFAVWIMRKLLFSKK